MIDVIDVIDLYLCSCFLDTVGAVCGSLKACLAWFLSFYARRQREQGKHARKRTLAQNKCLTY
jgi:hypothetical protein